MILNNYSAIKCVIYNEDNSYTTNISSYNIRIDNGQTLFALSLKSNNSQTAQNTGLSNIFIRLSEDTNISENDYTGDKLNLSLTLSKSATVQNNKYVRTFIVTGVNTLGRTINIRQLLFYKTFYSKIGNLSQSFENYDILLAKENIDEVVVEPNGSFTIAATWAEY